MLMLWMLLACGEKDSSSALIEQVDLSDTITVEDIGADVEFSTAKQCGECHPTHYAQWQQSMHAYAAHSPVFDAMAQKAYRDTSGAVGTFCTGCHSPIGTIQGEDGSTQAHQRSDISKDSVSCEVCHSAVTHDNPVGNLSLRLTTTGEKYGPFDDIALDGHDSLQNPFLSSPTLCGSCHDVFNFPGLRIEEAFSEYAMSPAAEMDVTCQDCHMSPIPGRKSERTKGPIAVVEGEVYPDRELSSHRFIGPDYSLIDNFPYPNDLDESATAQIELKEQIHVLLQNSIQLSDLRRTQSNGEDVIELDIESLVTGHNVPTGFTSERQLWVSIEVRNQNGQLLYQSGDLDANGDLRDDHSWAVQGHQADKDTQLVNFQSKNRIRHGEVTLPDISETVFPFEADYIEKFSLRPLEVRTVQYTLPNSVSTDLGNAPANISVKLQYRNLPPYLLRALNLQDLVPRLEIFTIDTLERSL